MLTEIIVEGKVMGQKRPLFTDWHVALPPTWQPGGSRITLRDLITRIVLEEVEAFRTRQSERRLARVLSRAEIEQGVLHGKVDSGERDLQQNVDPETAVVAALQAFEDGLYFVFIDGQQQTGLDREVALKTESQVTFIRLVALAGG